MKKMDWNQMEIIMYQPELYLMSAIMLILTYGTLYNASRKHRYPVMTYGIGYLCIQTLIITLALTGNGAASMPAWGPSIANVGILNGTLIVDTFATFVKTIVLIGTTITLLITIKYTLNKKMAARINEYMILILFGTLSALLLVSSFDLLSLYLAIELQSLSFYVLAAFQRNNEFSSEAGLKYFILGALSSGLLLFGESIIYGLTGITNFEELTKFLAGPETSMISEMKIGIPIGLSFISVAFLFKLSAVPFHLWTPDVYEGAPTSVTAYFAITPKIAILGLLIRLYMYTFYDWIESWQQIIMISALLSMFIGTLGAINQMKIKRLYAYSSIAHVGYLLIGLATGTIESIEAVLIYITLYVVVVMGTFSILLVMAKENFSIQKNYGYGYGYGNAYGNGYGNGNGNGYGYGNVNGNGNGNGIYKPTERYLNYVTEGQGELRKKLIQGNPMWEPKEYLRREGKRSLKLSETRGKIIKSGKHINEFSGLAKTNPILAFTAAMIFFSNAGIPPLAGFYGKLNVFLAAIENMQYVLALGGILCSVIGTFYSIRLVKIVYFHSIKEQTWQFYQSISKENGLVLGLTLAFTLFFCFAPSYLFLCAHSAALSLCI